VQLVWYGPTARLADLWHGWRDGAARIPDPDRGTATTPHREVLIRRAQDTFEHERIRYEAGRAGISTRLVQVTAQYDQAEAALAAARSRLADVPAELPAAELDRRRYAENRLHPLMVRLRRSREHGRSRRELIRTVAVAQAELDARTTELAACRSELERHRVIAGARVVRIHEHAHKRLSSYRRRLVRSHPDGAWISQTMDSLQPELPSWGVRHGTPANPPRRPDLPPAADDTAEPARPISIGDHTTFGSAPERVEVPIEGQYGVAPRHATLTRHGDRFQLEDHGTGDGTFVDGQAIRTATLEVGAAFTIGDQQFRIVATDLLEETQLARCDLVVAGLNGHARRGGKQLLTAMSFLQRSRSLLAILGPSGAGKSTLFSALLGELELGDGLVFFRDRNLRSHGPELRTRLGFVPQKDDTIHHSLTVRRLLTYSDRLRRPTAAKSAGAADIARVCRQLGIDNQLDDPVRSLSGGERRRVSIALEILAEPDLLMLDEPTSGLDPGMDREVMMILQDLASAGRAVIVVTHATEHLALADQVLIVAGQGRPVYSGPPDAALLALNAGSWADLMVALKNDPRLEADRYQSGRVAHAARVRAAELNQRPDPAAEADQLRPTGRLRRQAPVLVRRQAALMVTRAPIRHEKLVTQVRGAAVIGAPFLVAAATAYLAALVTGAGGLGGPTAQTAVSLLATVHAQRSGPLVRRRGLGVPHHPPGVPDRHRPGRRAAGEVGGVRRRGGDPGRDRDGGLPQGPGRDHAVGPVAAVGRALRQPGGAHRDVHDARVAHLGRRRTPGTGGRPRHRDGDRAGRPERRPHRPHRELGRSARVRAAAAGPVGVRRRGRLDRPARAAERGAGRALAAHRPALAGHPRRAGAAHRAVRCDSAAMAGPPAAQG
jgi:ABC-type multidrug transport system ATPase subunit